MTGCDRSEQVGTDWDRFGLAVTGGTGWNRLEKVRTGQDRSKQFIFDIIIGSQIERSKTLYYLLKLFNFVELC